MRVLAPRGYPSTEYADIMCRAVTSLVRDSAAGFVFSWFRKRQSSRQKKDCFEGRLPAVCFTPSRPASARLSHLGESGGSCHRCGT